MIILAYIGVVSLTDNMHEADEEQSHKRSNPSKLDVKNSLPFGWIAMDVIASAWASKPVQTPPALISSNRMAPSYPPDNIIFVGRCTAKL